MSPLLHAEPRRRGAVVRTPRSPRLRVSPGLKPFGIAVGVFEFLWLCARVAIGATDLRAEMHRHGLD